MKRQSVTLGFTLVELLVVIAIIGVLMGLLLPAVQSAREAGRRTTCSNNQYQMAFASIRFNDTTGFLPGWRNSLPTTSGTLFPSWPVMILPFAERNDIFKNWQAGTASAVYVSMFVCPSTPPDSLTGSPIAYAGNCGSGSVGTISSAGAARNIKGDGVMLDTASPVTLSINGVPRTFPNRMSVEEVSEGDGSSLTLLLSEKCGQFVNSSSTGLWSSVWNASPSPASPPNSVSSPKQVGTSVAATEPPMSFSLNGVIPPGFTQPIGSPTKAINPSDRTTVVQNWVARLPSSNHPGGAVVAFCDGHTGFLKDSVRIPVLGQLMTADTAADSDDIATLTSSVPVLSEGEFQ